MIEDIIAVLKNGCDLVMQGAAAHGPVVEYLAVLCHPVAAAQNCSLEGATPYYSSQVDAEFSLSDRGFPGDIFEFASLVASLQAQSLGQEIVELPIARAQTAAEATAVHDMLVEAIAQSVPEAGIECVRGDGACEKSVWMPAALPEMKEGASSLKKDQRVECEPHEPVSLSISPPAIGHSPPPPPLSSSTWVPATIVHTRASVYSVVFDDGTFEGQVSAGRLRMPKQQARSPFGRARAGAGTVPLECEMVAFERHALDGRSAAVHRIHVPSGDMPCESTELLVQSASLPEVRSY